MFDFWRAMNKIENKNQGGCLWCCYVFWKYLDKHNLDRSSFQIIQYAYYEDDITHNLNYINNGKDFPQSSTHFTWLYEGKEYDGEGEHYPLEHLHRSILVGLNTPTMTMVDEFCIKALNYSSWNSSFKRYKAHPIVLEDLDIDLEEIKM